MRGLRESLRLELDATRQEILQRNLTVLTARREVAQATPGTRDEARKQGRLEVLEDDLRRVWDVHDWLSRVLNSQTSDDAEVPARIV